MFEIMARVHLLQEHLEREEGQGQSLGVFHVGSSSRAALWGMAAVS